MSTPFSELKQSIIQSHSCLDFFKYTLGCSKIYRPGQCINAPSFIRSDHSPSFAVYDDHCFDFATQKSYNILDLYALYYFSDCDDFSNILKAAENLSGKKLSSPLHEASSLYDSQQSAFQSLIRRLHDNFMKNPIVSPNGKDIRLFDYLLSRRISIDTAQKLSFGYVPHFDDELLYMHDRLIVPYFLYPDYSKPVYANGRDLTGKAGKLCPKYKKLSLDDTRFNLILQNCIWGKDSQRPGRIIPDTRFNPDTNETETLETHHVKYDYLVISEGEFDTLAFWQEGYNVASALGCGFSAEQKKDLIQCCKHFTEKGQKVFLCLDNDSRGRQAQYNLALLLFKNRIPFVVGSLPESMTATYPLHPNTGETVSIKDVSDYYSAGGELEDLIIHAKSGVSYLAEHCRNERELGQLFQETAKLADKTDLLFLKKAAISIMDDHGPTEYLDRKTGEIKTVMDKKPRFPRDVVNYLFQIASQPLLESVVAELSMKNRKILYDTIGQFYEYAGGVWRAVPDVIIQKYIDHAMGHKLSSRKLAAVCAYIKVICSQTNLQFNNKPLWVFRNGTLWLDEPDNIHFTGQATGAHYVQTNPDNFRESDPEDMATIQMPYDYKYGAENKTWEKYVAEWMNGDTQKIKLAQQMMGYILFAANKLQKFFYLIGDGANGKSTFLHVLEAVFGKENCSSLQFHRFGSEFDAITLKNSRVNICYDAKTELGGAEEILKAVSSGDAIMAAHKGVDAETFTTNAKIFVAANRFFSANDVSKGLLRRILFLCFDRNFEGEGVKTNIEDEIRKDPGGLAGVFNWAYEGYKMLKADNRFIETDEQNRLAEEFKTQLSPLMVFAREEMYCRYDTEIDERDLFTIFKNWADANCERKINRTKFIYEIRQVLRTDGSAVKTEKNNDGLWVFVFPSSAGHSGGSGPQNDEGQDSGGQIQDQKAPADEGSTHAHNDVLSGNERGNDESLPDGQALQKTQQSKQVGITPRFDVQRDKKDKKAKVKVVGVNYTPTKDPDFVPGKKPLLGLTNAQIWDMGKELASKLCKFGRKWQQAAKEYIHNFRAYYAMNAFFNQHSAQSEFWLRQLPGYWDFFSEEILPKFNMADDEVGTMIPITEGR